MQDPSNLNNKLDEGKASPKTVPSARLDDGIDLFDILNKYFIPHWKKYVVVSFLCGVFFAAISYTMTPQFCAHVTAQTNMGASSNLMRSGLNGLASFAGLNLNRGDANALFNTKFITSRELADAFVAKYDLRRELFARSYDEKGEYLNKTRLKEFYTKLLGPDYTTVQDDDVFLTPGPTNGELYKKFSSVFVVDVDKKSLTVTVTVTWKSPLKAKQWANDYIALVNSVLKEKAVNESNRKIKYLEGQIKENPEIEVQQSIYSLIENELKQVAIAESSDEYAFKVVERAYLPERKSTPVRRKLLFMGALIGFFSVFAYVYLRELFRDYCSEKRK